MSDGPLNWADTPRMPSEDFHARPGGKEWRFDQTGIFFRNAPNSALRTGGQPQTARAILAAYGAEILDASRTFHVPPELIVMTIATEAGRFRSSNFTGPKTFRWEPGITDYSAGPMQVLSSTARGVINTTPVPLNAAQVPPPPLG